MKIRYRLGIAAAWLLCVILDRHVLPAHEGPEVYEAFLGALIGGVTSLIGGISGAAAANRRRREADAMLRRKERRLDAWRDAEMGANYLDRADSRAALRRVEEANREAQKAFNTEAVKRGMTDEAKVAQAARLNEGYADTVSQIAAIGQQHKDQVQRQYRAEKNAIEDMRIQNLMDTSGASAMGQGIASAGGALASSLIGGLGGGGTAVPAPDFSKVRNMAASGFGVPKFENYQITL